MNNPTITKAPRPRLMYMAVWSKDTALFGKEVGVGRGVCVGVGDEATRKGVGKPTSNLFGVGVTMGVGIDMGASFWIMTGTATS